MTGGWPSHEGQMALQGATQRHSRELTEGAPASYPMTLTQKGWMVLTQQDGQRRPCNERPHLICTMG